MSVITIISDFGYKDYYISALKAKIYSLIPNAKIVDITHDVKKFDFKEGVFTLKNVLFEFPENTIHIFAVNETGTKNDHDFYAFKIKNQFVIGTGLSFISLFNEFNKTIVKLPKSNKNNTFPSFSVFAQTAFQLLKNTNLLEIGIQIPDISVQKNTQLDVQQNSILGTVIHIDDYGNIITNITKSIFEEARNNRPFMISIGRESIRKINSNYHEQDATESLCLFNENQLLVVAIAFENASRLLGVNKDANVKIIFN